ncbi:MAG: PD-(D/E)XK nuclease family protein [Erysipelotrichales bacterium]
MYDFINKDKKTALIIPTKYHNELVNKLLTEKGVLYNLSLVSIDAFCNETLELNKYPSTKRDALETKLNLHQQLVSIDHQYAYNTNYIDELYKLEKEVVLSNIDFNDLNFTNSKIEFNNLNTTYDEIFILSYEDFYPLHHQVISNLDIKVIIKDLYRAQEQLVYEHDNIIQMLDYIIYGMYNNKSDNTLIVVDDSIQIDYLTKQFDLIGLAYNLERNSTNINSNIIKALFKIIDGKSNKYDTKLIKKKYIDEEKLAILIKEDNQKEYLIKLYDVLYDTSIFESKKLNELFTTLYLKDTLSKKILNKYILETLLSFINKSELINANIMIASSSFNSLGYDKAYVVDASLSGLNSTKTSFLLNQKQRSNIDISFIDNGFYNQKLKEAQSRLINCAKSIEFHYCLNSIDNKPQELAFFIKDLNLEISDKKEFSHLTIHTKKDKVILNTNNIQLDNRDILSDKFNNKLRISSTSMDSFYACPYRYFVNYILKPKVKQSFSYLELGSIYHKVLEKINNYVIETSIKYHQLDKDFISKTILEVVEKFELDDLSINKIKYNIDELIKHLIKHETYSKYNVFASEQQLSYEYNDINVVGNIDLIMNYNDYYYIIDYKSSTKKFDEKSFNSGLSNQLIIYLSLLKQQGYNLTGAFYKAIQTKYIPTKEILNDNIIETNFENAHKLEGIYIDSTSRKDFDSSFEIESTISTAREKKTNSSIFEIEQILTYFETLNNNMDNMKEGISNANFPILPYEKMTCEYCDYKNICKVNNKTLTRKELESNE